AGAVNVTRERVTVRRRRVTVRGASADGVDRVGAFVAREQVAHVGRAVGAVAPRQRRGSRRDVTSEQPDDARLKSASDVVNDVDPAVTWLVTRRRRGASGR